MSATQLTKAALTPPRVEPLIRVVGVGRRYRVGDNDVVALADVSFDVRPEEFVVVLGPSGCGKTTLLNMIGALDSPTEGRVVVAGRDITRASRKELFEFRRHGVSFVFQTFNLFPALTALENAEFGADIAGRPDPGAIAAEMLERVGLGHRLRHFPHELSGGEQQRVAIARALASGNPTLLADEPTGELDFRTGIQILELHRWQVLSIAVLLALGVGMYAAMSSMTIIIALSGLMDSFDGTLAASRQEALAGAHDRMTVDLATPQRADTEDVQRVSSARTVGATQTSLRVASTLRAGSRRVDVALETISDWRPLWHPTFDAGALPSRSPGLVIARRAAEDLHVALGDRLTVVHPVPTGPRTFRLVRTALPVTGIHASPLRFIAYANAPAAGELHLAGLVNRISVVPAPGHDADDVKAELLRQPAVAAVQGAAATTDAVDKRMEQFNEILLITVAIAGAMALLIAFNATAINADERAREHATMFAYGVTVARVLRGSIAESLIVGALGTTAGIAAGHAVLSWIVNENMPQTMPDIGTLISVAPISYALAAAAGTLIVAAAPLLTVGKLRVADIPAALRVVE